MRAPRQHGWLAVPLVLGVVQARCIVSMLPVRFVDVVNVSSSMLRYILTTSLFRTSVLILEIHKVTSDRPLSLGPVHGRQNRTCSRSRFWFHLSICGVILEIFCNCTFHCSSFNSMGTSLQTLLESQLHGIPTAYLVVFPWRPRDETRPWPDMAWRNSTLRACPA